MEAGNKTDQELSQLNVLLVVEQGGADVVAFVIKVGDSLIGRLDPKVEAYPDIDLEKYDLEAKISRKHALVHFDGKELFVEDLGSLNGTYLNRGSQLKPNERCRLNDGDEVMIGRTFLRVCCQRTF